MSAKLSGRKGTPSNGVPDSLPPGRPHGSLDLLDATGPAGTPRDGVPDPSWRADALGRSRHSRLASEMREPLDDADPDRAERLCAEVTRDALGDYAPALLLLSADRRRRAQTLTAWTVALFDFALRPGFAGLDGDRLAQINAWEFRTEEALDGNPPGQPVFVAMAREEIASPWPREALDEIGAMARRWALAPEPENQSDMENRTAADLERAVALGRALCRALFGAECLDELATRAVGPLIGIAIQQARIPPGASTQEAPTTWIEEIEAARVAGAPPGWRRAASYARRALSARLRPGTSAAKLGLTTRLRLLALSLFR